MERKINDTECPDGFAILSTDDIARNYEDYGSTSYELKQENGEIIKVEIVFMPGSFLIWEQSVLNAFREAYKRNSDSQGDFSNFSPLHELLHAAFEQAELQLKLINANPNGAPKRQPND